MTSSHDRTDSAFHETLGRLTRGALHELANPLVAVIGSAELALGELEPGTKALARIELVHRTALEVADLVRALQAFTRERTSPPRRLELATVAADAVRLVQLVGATPDVELSLRREAEPVVVAAPGALGDDREHGVAIVTVEGGEVLRLPLEAAA